MGNIQNDNETISLKKIIVNYLRQWKLFVIAAAISSLFALVYLIFMPKTYEMMTKIQLVEDKSSGSSGFNVGDASGLMKSFGLGGMSGGAVNLDDEMAKLTSNSTLIELVLKLGLNVTYYKPYAYKYKMYEHSPLQLSTDSITLRNLDCTIAFSVKVEKDGRVRVDTEAKKIEKSFDFASLPAEIKLDEGVFILSDRNETHKPLSLDLEISPAGWIAESLSNDLLFDEYSKNANVIEISCTDYETKRGVDVLRTLVDI